MDTPSDMLNITQVAFTFQTKFLVFNWDKVELGQFFDFDSMWHRMDNEHASQCGALGLTLSYVCISYFWLWHVPFSCTFFIYSFLIDMAVDRMLYYICTCLLCVVTSYILCFLVWAHCVGYIITIMVTCLWQVNRKICWSGFFPQAKLPVKDEAAWA